MKVRLVAAAALVASLAVPAFAVNELYVVQDGKTKKCTVVDKKPTEASMTVVSPAGAVYKTKAEAEAGNTLRSVVENYLAREGGKLRTADAQRAAFERLVFPKLGGRQIDEIKRSDINKLLDTIEDERGPRMASRDPWNRPFGRGCRYHPEQQQLGDNCLHLEWPKSARPR